MKIRINNIGAQKPIYAGNEPDNIDDLVSIVKYDNLPTGEEYCFSIAMVENDNKEGCTQFETVGSRILDLTKEERDWFFEVYRIVDNMFMLKRMKDKSDY